MPLLIAEALAYRYPDRDRLVVHDLSLSLERGQLVRVVGRNGAGKTTALRLLAGELAPTFGRLTLSQHTNRFYLDQDASSILALDLTIEDHIRGFRDASRARTLDPDLSRFTLPLHSLVRRFGGQLSGGERQIFALLCALGGAYNVLLLDEFTSHLDDQSEHAAFDLLAEALAQRAVGVVLVSHRPIPLKTDEELELGTHHVAG